MSNSTEDSSEPTFPIPSHHRESWPRLLAFAARAGTALDKLLGWGVEGLVISTTAKTAIKAYRHQELYVNERNVYLRLRDRSVSHVAGFAVPQLVNFDDELWIVEMRIVSRPFVLDFAGAYLDRRPPFSAEQWSEWTESKREQFEERWDEVQSVIFAFQQYGIYLSDVKPGNIMFGPDPN